MHVWLIPSQLTRNLLYLAVANRNQLDLAMPTANVGLPATILALRNDFKAQRSYGTCRDG